MVDYKKLHFMLFCAAADALETPGSGERDFARELLTRAQQDAGELYIQSGGE